MNVCPTSCKVSLILMKISFLGFQVHVLSHVFLPFSTKGDNFGDFLLASLYIQVIHK